MNMKVSVTAAGGDQSDVSATREAERSDLIRSVNGETKSNNARTNITSEGTVSFTVKGDTPISGDPSQVSNVDKKRIEKFSKPKVIEVNRKIKNNITHEEEQFILESRPAKVEANHDQKLISSTRIRIFFVILLVVVLIAVFVISILSNTPKMKDQNQEQATKLIDSGLTFPPISHIESLSQAISSVPRPNPTTQTVPSTSISLTTQRTSTSVTAKLGLKIKIGGTREEGASDQILYLPSRSDQKWVECDKHQMPSLPGY